MSGKGRRLVVEEGTVGSHHAWLGNGGVTWFLKT